MHTSGHAGKYHVLNDCELEEEWSEWHAGLGTKKNIHASCLQKNPTPSLKAGSAVFPQNTPRTLITSIVGMTVNKENGVDRKEEGGPQAAPE